MALRYAGNDDVNVENNHVGHDGKGKADVNAEDEHFGLSGEDNVEEDNLLRGPTMIIRVICMIILNRKSCQSIKQQWV